MSDPYLPDRSAGTLDAPASPLRPEPVEGQGREERSELRRYLDTEFRRRLWHKVLSDKPYDECECSEGGPCRPKDPANRPVLRGWSNPGGLR